MGNIDNRYVNAGRPSIAPGVEARSPFDWLSMLALVFMAWLAGQAMSVAAWTTGVAVVRWLAVFGVLAGGGLARSRFSGLKSGLLAACYGAAMVGWRMGLLIDPALDWDAKFRALAGRFVSAGLSLANGQLYIDPLVFLTIMSIIYWFMGVYASWAVFRRGGSWLAVFPLGLALLLNAYFYQGPAHLTTLVAWFVLAALCLAIRSSLDDRRRAWIRMQAQVPSDAGYQITRTALIAAAVLVAVAWGGPSFAQSPAAGQLWSEISSPWRSIGETLGDALVDLKNASVPVSDFYGDTLSLSSGQVLPDQVIMRARPDAMPSNGGRLYWRERIYDVYQEGSWSSGGYISERLDPAEGGMAVLGYTSRQQIQVTIWPLVPALHTLYTPSMPVWVSRTSRAYMVRTGQGVVDVTMITARGVIAGGESYSVRSLVDVPSIAELQKAGRNLPNWVQTRDLALPDTITARTRALARSVTRQASTPYEQAQSITEWLRQNMRYNRTIEAPPPDVDPVDWFLFDSKTGFCNYYASAEVILLRSLGIPARLAVGYAQGEIASDGDLVIRGTDAHAWPEVYFPGIGWVEFEPTASQPELIRPAMTLPTGDLGYLREGPHQPTPPSSPASTETGKASSGASRPAAGLPWVPLLLGILAAAALVAGGWAWVRLDPALWAHGARLVSRGLGRLGLGLSGHAAAGSLPAATPVGEVYSVWSQWLPRLGLPLLESQTPYERAAAFGAAIPSLSEAGWAIAGAYAAERYGHSSVDLSIVMRAWSRLRPYLWQAWLRRWWSSRG
jgi:hypothetical protein